MGTKWLKWTTAFVSGEQEMNTREAGWIRLFNDPLDVVWSTGVQSFVRKRVACSSRPRTVQEWNFGGNDFCNDNDGKPARSVPSLADEMLLKFLSPLAAMRITPLLRWPETTALRAVSCAQCPFTHQQTYNAWETIGEVVHQRLQCFAFGKSGIGCATPRLCLNERKKTINKGLMHVAWSSAIVPWTANTFFMLQGGQLAETSRMMRESQWLCGMLDYDKRLVHLLDWT